jgi:ribonuclease HI
VAIVPRVKVFFDGGCRPNPGRMEIAVVVQGKTYLQRDLGVGTSLHAEWLALIEAVKIADALDVPDPVFLGDALAVIGPATGVVKCRSESVQHFNALMALRSAHGALHIRHVKRAQNLAGIALSRLHV